MLQLWGAVVCLSRNAIPGQIVPAWVLRLHHTPPYSEGTPTSFPHLAPVSVRVQLGGKLMGGIPSTCSAYIAIRATYHRQDLSPSLYSSAEIAPASSLAKAGQEVKGTFQAPEGATVSPAHRLFRGSSGRWPDTNQLPSEPRHRSLPPVKSERCNSAITPLLAGEVQREARGFPR